MGKGSNLLVDKTAIIPFGSYLQDLNNINCQLTPSQSIICELICFGFKAPDIAKILCRSSHTIESHIKQIKIKTQIDSTTALACWYTSQKMRKIPESRDMQMKDGNL